jgi:hypothetical protein
MALCANVYVRGLIFWWRRRFVDSTGHPHLVALSLRVRDPVTARILGSRLNAEALLIGRRASVMRTSVEIRNRLSGVLEQGWFEVDDHVLAKIRCADAPVPNIRDRLTPPTLSFSREQERAMLTDLARKASIHYADQACVMRERPWSDDGHQSIDPIATAVAVEISRSLIYNVVAKEGPAASLTTAGRALLAEAGLPAAFIDCVARDVAFHARNEAADSWTLGPDRAFFADILTAHGIDARIENVRRLRRGYLALSAEILRDAPRRHAEADAPVAGILADICALAADTAIASVPVRTGGDVLELDGSPEIRPSRPDFAPVKSATGDRERAVSPIFKRLMERKGVTTVGDTIEPLAYGEDPVTGERFPSFIRSVDMLCSQRVGKGWSEKTGLQHQSLARLFTKLADTDDARQLSQTDVNAYRILLSLLPKNWGKSQHDAKRSIDEILTRCDDVDDDDEIGLASGTIDRHLTQLSSILSYFAAAQIEIGSVSKALRSHGDFVARPCFDYGRDLEQGLFLAPVWTGAKSVEDRTAPGRLVVHDAQYWGPLLGTYLFLRLSEMAGLELADLSEDVRVLSVRSNSTRRLKTKESERDLPVPPEMLRLGFVDYVRMLRVAGHKLLFPELATRGKNTPLQNFFYKDFSTILWCALPYAREMGLVFHAFRKTGNTLLVNENADPVVRQRILGHTVTGVNGVHYTGPLWLSRVATELAKIPNVTGHLAARPIRLHDALKGK